MGSAGGAASVAAAGADRQRLYGRRCNLAAGVLLFAFAGKVLLIGQALFGPWDFPDELQHFAYVEHVAGGRGLPVLFLSRVGPDVWQVVTPQREAPLLRMAQHPPAYYLLLAPVYALAVSAGIDPAAGERHVIAMLYTLRLASGALILVGLLLLYLLLRDLAPDPRLAVAALGAVLALPNLSYHAAGLNSDHLLFLLTHLALFAGWRYGLRGGAGWLVLFVCAAALASVTKYTAIVLLAVPVLAVFVLCWRRAGAVRALAMGVGAVPLLLWMLRNYLALGDPLPLTPIDSSNALPMLSLQEFVVSHDLLREVFQHFIAQIGFTPVAAGEVSLFRAGVVDGRPYLLVMLLCAALSLCALLRATVRKLMLPVLLLVLTVGWGARGWVHASVPLLPWLLAVLAGVVVASHQRPLNDTPNQVLVRLAQASVLLFVLVWTWQMYQATAAFGQLRGAQGRYLLPALGALLVGFMVPGWSVQRRVPWLLPLLALGLWVAEARFWFGPAAAFLVAR